MAAALLCALLPAMVDAAPIDAPPPRCVGCGVVESIRALEPVAGSPAAYEFNVRLRDGSLRTSIGSGESTWRVGDRILLMGGAGPRLPSAAAHDPLR